MDSSIWITEHGGKMEGIRSINTNPLTNDFCKFMHGHTNTICEKCYAHPLTKMREGLRNHIQNNSELLSSGVLIPSVLPKYDDQFMRFNSFGELINANHLINIFSICYKNPFTTHVIYSKRLNLIEMFSKFIPGNLIIVESNPWINHIREKPISPLARYVFNVITEDYMKVNKINISCIKHCNACRKCYKFCGEQCIIELIK